jgi:hypothetical protein
MNLNHGVCRWYESTATAVTFSFCRNLRQLGKIFAGNVKVTISVVLICPNDYDARTQTAGPSFVCCFVYPRYQDLGIRACNTERLDDR